MLNRKRRGLSKRRRHFILIIELECSVNTFSVHPFRESSRGLCIIHELFVTRRKGGKRKRKKRERRLWRKRYPLGVRRAGPR